MLKSVLIAGTNSGCGKTTITLGLMAAFSKKGLKVQAFKAGPDYIDPSLHYIVTKRPSINLDTWMMPAEFLKASFVSHAKEADFSIIEGVMGFYDGRSPVSDEGSSADLAKKIECPVILVIDAKSMARTVSAILKGMIEFDRKVNIIGVILNNIGSKRHLEILEEAIRTYCNITVFGGLPKDPGLSLPSRHLGLITGGEGVLSRDKIEYLSSSISSNIDLDKIEKMSQSRLKEKKRLHKKLKAKGVIAVARDKAFCFYYQDNLNILSNMGYEIVEFSPIKDKVLPASDIIYLGGGYPEVYADEISQNVSMLNCIRKAGDEGRTIYAECGGLMYLGRSIITLDGEELGMCGSMPYKTRMLPKRKSLGYVEISPMEDFWILSHKQKIRGHVFHYSEVIMPDNAACKNFYQGTPKSKAIGLRYGNILASYVHLHFGAICVNT